jgi:hypothetical protein
MLLELLFMISVIFLLLAHLRINKLEKEIDRLDQDIEQLFNEEEELFIMNFDEDTE